MPGLKVAGKVIDKKTQKPIARLGIEVWKKEEPQNRPAAQTVTDTRGTFRVEFTEAQLEEIFEDREPIFYIKIYLREQLITSTEDTVLWRRGARPKTIRIELPPTVAEERPTFEIHEVMGRLINEQTGAPLAGYRVRIFDLKEEEPEEISYDITDPRGVFALDFSTVRETVPEEEEEPEPSPRKLKLHIISPEGKDIYQTEVAVDPEQPKLVEIKIPTNLIPTVKLPTLRKINRDLRVKIPAALLDALEERDLRTLDDIRRLEDISAVSDIAADDESKTAMKRLEAHANLSVMSLDVKSRDLLVDNGFTNLSSITSETRAEFVKKMSDTLGDLQSAKVHVQAKAQSHVLNNILTQLRIEHANGFSIISAESESKIPKKLFPLECSCRDCEAAVSPLAYLADLLNYALTHIKNDDKIITLGWLEENFHQPFKDLPASCEEMDRKVRQIRVCIEILRRYLAVHPVTDPDKKQALSTAEKDYRLKTYTSLLNKIGTSYDEIRLVQNTDEETRKALADRIGIDLNSDNTDTLAELFFDATADPEVLTETEIERLFGLVETTRDCLSEGAKLGDDQQQITRWNLDGAEWNWNTDPNGFVYVTLVKESASNYQIVLFKDENKTQLVASGKASSPKKKVKLFEKNDSGLSGIFHLDYKADGIDIRISAIPCFLCWRLKHLRTLWKLMDWPSDPYTEDAAGQLPIIDPDIIGPDDMRNPKTGYPPFDLWLARRNWIDGLLVQLKSDHQTNDLETILKQVLGDPLPDLENLQKNLEEGIDLENTKKTITEDLYLTVESFQRLVEIRTKDQTAANNPEAESVTDEEWSELYSILVLAKKNAQHADWIQEEKQNGILLGPKQFWFSEREPSEGDWPPVLVENCPLIDPEEIALDDLPEPTVGMEAIEIWKARREKLNQLYKDLKAENESNGFDAVMRMALGHPDPGDALPHDMATLKSELDSTDPSVVAQAEEKITKDFYMTTDKFNRVMEIKTKVDAAVKPNDEEWAEVYAILTTAQKAKREYSAWISEEKQEGMDTDYWRALKARLPRWRAPSETRPMWRLALRSSSKAPIIDPDLIGPGDMKNPIITDPAFDIWKERSEWIDINLSTLKQSPKDLGGFDTNVENILGVAAAHLDGLVEKEAQGNSITARLEQLNLPRDAFYHLVRIRDLLESQSPVLESEWEDVYSILVQVQKCREFTEWHQKEQLSGLILSPDAFKIPKPPPPQFPLPEPEPLTPWRARWRDQRDWQDLLQSRIDQEKVTIDALHEAVSDTGESTLTSLRDALIASLDEGGTAFEGKAKWVIDHLLIDAKAGGCQLITRVAQAIETIQGLLWSVRTGQLKDTFPELELDADDFEDEWEWIGSYTTWRSAMFVFLYPENILIPSLCKKNTPTFVRLANSVRKTRRLTRNATCEAARAFSEYYQDVCTLTVEATCRARTRLHKGEGCEYTATGYSSLFYMFGRGEKTNTLYWSCYNPDDETGNAQTFWEPVPAVNNVTSVIGAAPYKINEDERYIYLFLLTTEKRELKLVYVRYDLERGFWDGEPVELELPEDERVNAAVLFARSEKTRPWLFLHTNKDLYLRKLSEDGTELDPEPTNPQYDPDNPQSDNEWEAFHYMQFWEVGVEQFHAVIPDSFYGHLCCFTGLDKNLYIAAHSIKLSLSKNLWLGWVQVEKQTYVIIPGTSSPAYILLEDGLSGIESIGPMFPGLKNIVPQAGDLNADTAHIVYHRIGTHAGVYRAFARSVKEPSQGKRLDFTDQVLVTPHLAGPFDISPANPDESQQHRRMLISFAFINNEAGPESNLTYLREAYYFFPVLLALQLQKCGEFTGALDWFRTVYDYSAPKGKRKIYYGLKQEETLHTGFERTVDWLMDPLDPHAIAETRRNTYTRFTILALVRCFLDYADAEFTRDTIESVSRARTLYLTAVELLEGNELKQHYGFCDELIGMLDIKVGGSKWKPALSHIKAELAMINDKSKLKLAVGKVTKALEADEPLDTRFSKALAIVAGAKAKSAPPTFMDIVEKRGAAHEEAHKALLAQDSIAKTAAVSGEKAAADFSRAVSLVSAHSRSPNPSGGSLVWLRAPRVCRLDPVDLGAESRSALLFYKKSHAETLKRLAAEAPLEAVKIVKKFPAFYSPSTSYKFCIPLNPVIEFYRLHAELNLYKIRTCRNIAGMQRQLEPYAAPTDTVTGLPMIGVGGQLVLPGMPTPPPTQYRYSILIERAKQLVQLAAQIETTMLSSLEKRDAEYFNILKARQDVQLARQGIRLQSLRLKEATDNVELAVLQRDRAQIQVDTYTTWIIDGLNMYELAMVEAYREAELARTQAAYVEAATQAAQAATTAAAGGAAAGAAAVSAAAVAAGALLRAYYTEQAIGAEISAQISAVYANFERRKDEWELQKALAEQDILIANQQIKIAKDHVRVVGQEHMIAVMQADHAKETLEFLKNKFTNVELYSWMSDILEGVYAFFLQQATATAKLAENQLAFERQETTPGYIQADYWEAPVGLEIGSDFQTSGPDRRGLTGSARLLQDIYQLDQYAFETNKRKLQLTKTISLAQQAPVEFQRFRENGIMLFATPMELFDRDFPGHYLRLIRRVRTSVVALIPPTSGIHATLSTTGLSRAVIGSTGLYQTVQVRTFPESVALTSPVNATGVFELTPYTQEMMMPFEGMGVDALWEFRMPKASNQFDYRTIADVLLTIEYTALDSFDYRQQIIQQLDSRMSADRPFSFRHEFADQWYDLHNPDQTSTPLTVKFKTRDEDFPPNIDNLKIQQVVLYFSRTDGVMFEIPVTHLRFTEKNGIGTVGGGASTIDGIISTRKGNAGSWIAMMGKSPVGAWELALPDDYQTRQLFKDGKIADIFFIITYSGNTPAYSI